MRVLDVSFAQLSGGFDPVGILRQNDSARPLTIDLRMLGAVGHDAVFLEFTGSLQDTPSDANDHRITGTQMLSGPIVGGAHTFSDRCVLGRDASNTGVVRTAALPRTVDAEVV